MPGPPPKPAGMRQRTKLARGNGGRNQKGGELIRLAPKAVSRWEAPKAPRGFLKATKLQWEAYWSSPLARSVEPQTDYPAIERLFTLYDERRRAYRGFKRERLILGSMGQMVLNPLGRLMHELDAEIRQMEDRLGLTPRSRLQLGITFSEAARSMRELNENLEADFDDDPR